MTPVTLELGGKDPAVILPETNLTRSIPLWMRGVLCVIDCVAAALSCLTLLSSLAKTLARIVSASNASWCTTRSTTSLSGFLQTVFRGSVLDPALQMLAVTVSLRPWTVER